MTVPAGAVMALKPLRHAKSRLADIPGPLRQRLAWCMAVDTLRALSAVCTPVVVVSNEPDLGQRLAAYGLRVQVLPDPAAGGINPALAAGAEAVGAAGRDTVLACVADLPALRPDSVRRVLAAGAGAARTYLVDASGVGTTMLLARGTELQPRFSGRSAAAHRQSGAVPLSDERLGGPLSDARRDVDTEADLHDAYRLGVGPTTQVLFDGTGRLRPLDLVVIDGGGKARRADGRPVHLTSDALDTMVTLQPGITLHAVLAEHQVLAAWL